MTLIDNRMHATEAERRAAIRRPVELAARFVVPGDERQGHLADISQTGARLVHDKHIRPIERISGVLLFDQYELRCRIVWSRRDACGVIFDTPLTDADILAIIRKRDNHLR